MASAWRNVYHVQPNLASRCASSRCSLNIWLATCVSVLISFSKHFLHLLFMAAALIFVYLTGYAFTLTWMKNEAVEEPELLYRVLTLGTFERVAPEWMRSVLMFSMRMWPIFFERLACVIKLHRWLCSRILFLWCNLLLYMTWETDDKVKCYQWHNSKEKRKRKVVYLKKSQLSIRIMELD